MPSAPFRSNGTATSRGSGKRITLSEIAVGAFLLLTEALIVAILIQSFLSAGSV
jgi:hypothetical protein